MANEEQLSILKQGVDAWNRWRNENFRADIDLSNIDIHGLYLLLDGVNFSKANFRGATLNKAHLLGANLSNANLDGCDLRAAQLEGAKLNGASLNKADLSFSDLSRADLRQANLSGANLRRANLVGANFIEANLSETKLIEANLVGAILFNTNIDKANISRSKIYGVSVWDVKGEPEEQRDLVIAPPWAPNSAITIDNIKIAQFIYLILNNPEIREVINTLTSKAVLILGRFAVTERKEILDGIRNRLRAYNLLPIVFDFDRPTDRDFTETIKTLAGLCYFVIADVTNPKSSPLELQATIPDYQIPFVPIIQEGEQPFAMMADLKKYGWVLETRTYSTKEALLKGLKKGIIEPAMQKHNELRLLKAQKPDTVSLDDLED